MSQKFQMLTLPENNVEAVIKLCVFSNEMPEICLRVKFFSF